MGHTYVGPFTHDLPKLSVQTVNTILLSRTSATVLGYYRTVLGSNCVLDAILDEEHKVLWILDSMSWRDVDMADSEAEFR